MILVFDWAENVFLDPVLGPSFGPDLSGLYMPPLYFRRLSSCP